MNKYKFSILPALLLLMAGGCSDDDWTPGPVDDATGVSAYFNTPSKSEYIFGSDYDPEEMVINVTASRQVTDEEITVPLIVTSDTDKFVCPQSVTFPAGEDEATFTIDCSNIDKGEFFDLNVELDPAQTNIYGIGQTSVTYKVIKADWLEISDNVRYTIRDTSNKLVFPAVTSTMNQLEGTMIFRLNDFFGSGLNVRFECKDKNVNVFKPMDNYNEEYVYEEDLAIGGWYLYDDQNSWYPEWTPGGESADYPMITWMESFSNTSDCELEMIDDVDTLHGNIYFLSYLIFDDDSGAWYYLYVNYNLKYNPFN